jgi:dolichol-phosphate mannosyltransferase
MFDRQERFAGETKYPLKRMFRLALDGIFSLSKAPLRMAFWLGLISITLSFLLVVLLVIEKIVGRPGGGLQMLVTVFLFIGGVQLVCIRRARRIHRADL